MPASLLSAAIESYTPTASPAGDRMAASFSKATTAVNDQPDPNVTTNTSSARAGTPQPAASPRPTSPQRPLPFLPALRQAQYKCRYAPWVRQLDEDPSKMHPRGIDIPDPRRWHRYLRFKPGGFVPIDWKPAPAVVHNSTDNITDYYPHGNSPWEAFRNHRQQAADERIERGTVKKDKPANFSSPRCETVKRKHVQIVPDSRCEKSLDVREVRMRAWRTKVFDQAICDCVGDDGCIIEDCGCGMSPLHHGSDASDDPVEELIVEAVVDDSGCGSKFRDSNPDHSGRLLCDDADEESDYDADEESDDNAIDDDDEDSTTHVNLESYETSDGVSKTGSGANSTKSEVDSCQNDESWREDVSHELMAELAALHGSEPLCVQD